MVWVAKIVKDIEVTRFYPTKFFFFMQPITSKLLTLKNLKRLITVVWKKSKAHIVIKQWHQNTKHPFF